MADEQLIEEEFGRSLEETRDEIIDGKVYMMAPASWNHQTVMEYIHAEFVRSLKNLVWLGLE